MEFPTFSPKQLQVLQWWQRGSDQAELDGIICDGAVRSGKTLCLGLSFFLWAMCAHEEQQFALCGKTIMSVRRNMLSTVVPYLESLGFSCQEKVSQNKLVIGCGGRRNTFFLFGGKDEGASALIQGITLAGVLLDEVALMPRSFVEQALARCSVPGSRLWFSCNPESPGHWFYQEWILKAEEKRVLHLSFTMGDNPILSPKVKKRYEAMFQGTFYQRFVLGEWVNQEGLVYDFFQGSMLQPVPSGEMERYYISCDYGTVNPTSMGLWGLLGGIWYRVGEFYYDSRKEGKQKTDSEYAQDLAVLAGGRTLEGVVVDPSAASFIEVLRRKGYPVKKAKNQVLEGIRRTAELLKSGKLVICENCGETLRELGLYCWDRQCKGEDRVVKEHDHAMDELRYFASTVLGEAGEKKPGFSVGIVERRG